MSLNVKICFLEGYHDSEVEKMIKKALEHGLNYELFELNTEQAKNQPGLPYYATDYGTYLTFGSLKTGFERRGIILTKSK